MQSRIIVVMVLVVVSTSGVFRQTPASPKLRLDAIVKRQMEASKRYHTDLDGAKTPDAQKVAIDRFLGEVHKNTTDVLDLVKANSSDTMVVEALEFVIRTARAGPGTESEQAMGILLRDHVRDADMGKLCFHVFYFFHTPVAESLIRSVLENHSNRDDRGLACHALATYLTYKAKMVRRFREKPASVEDYEATRGKKAMARLTKETDPEALEKESEALLERVVAEFGDVKDPREQRTEGEVAAGKLFAMRNLTVGRVAPELSGIDHHGKRFALSEFRGKVVVLTFSGSWCGPCRGMYPQERALVDKLEDKPFALVSVNTDTDVETLRKSIASGEITWRCWWDGGTEGPITTRWGVSSFPSIFVLDGQGVIRFKDVRNTDLDRSVATLLEDAPAATR